MSKINLADLILITFPVPYIFGFMPDWLISLYAFDAGIVFYVRARDMLRELFR